MLITCIFSGHFAGVCPDLFSFQCEDIIPTYKEFENAVKKLRDKSYPDSEDNRHILNCGYTLSEYLKNSYLKTISDEEVQEGATEVFMQYENILYKKHQS